MYRIPNDARAQKSAQLICKGLEACLAEKPLSETRVADIHRKCFVSRSTFYRLFDSINDVIAYQCDLIFAEIVKMIDQKTFSTQKEKAVCCAKVWLKHPPFVKALVDNDLGWMIYQTHDKHFASLSNLYPEEFQYGRLSVYFISILSSIISTAMSVYIKNGSTETIEEAYDHVCACTSAIAKTLVR